MIKIYGKNNCTYCQKAKDLCRQYKLNFTYYPIDQNDEFFSQFMELFPNAKTVPQIMWDNKPIGGYNELTAEIENLGLGNYGQGDF
jgi:glutaredoxin